MENEACPVFSSVCDEDENDCESNNEAQIPNVPFLPKPGERQPLLMTSSDIQNAPSKSSSTSNTVPEYTTQKGNHHKALQEHCKAHGRDRVSLPAGSSQKRSEVPSQKSLFC